jgi:hypothetical protein
MSLPSVVNDLVVNELWIEVQKSLSHQIGENDEITDAMADSMLTQLSQDLDELTQTIATKNCTTLSSVCTVYHH